MNNSKLTKTASVFMTVCFLFLIFSASVITITSEKQTKSYYENRKLATLPEYSHEGAADGSYFSALGTYVKDHAALREFFIMMNTKLDLDVLCRPTVNGIVMTDDVLLPYLDYETVDTESIAYEAVRVAEGLKARAELTESYGGNFYYVAVPSQYMCYDDSYPWYLNNRAEYIEASSKAFFDEMGSLGIDCIDMMAYYEESGEPEYFTSTVDHHFGILGAYYTYRAIAERYVLDTGVELDILDDGEYTLEYLPNKYVGSRSRKIFGLWNSDEKLGLITPNADVPFERYNNGIKGSSTVFTLPESDTEDVLYTAYMGGDMAHTLIDTNRDELPSILIYGESFTNAIETIAWYSFNEMHSLDLRYYNKTTFEEFIEEHKPDIVVCVRDYSVLLETEGYGH